MAKDRDPRLFEPSSAVIVLTIEQRPSQGWFLFVRRLDATGRATERSGERYGPLVWSELVDVVDAELTDAEIV